MSVVALCNLGNGLLLEHRLVKTTLIEQLYVIVKMLISCFCSECTISCCHLAYRERRKLRPQMRKIQTPSPQLTETEQFALNIVLAAFISCTELV